MHKAANPRPHISYMDHKLVDLNIGCRSTEIFKSKVWKNYYTNVKKKFILVYLEHLAKLKTTKDKKENPKKIHIIKKFLSRYFTYNT